MSEPKKSLRVWLINPYGPLPSEGWRDYSFVVIGRTLAAAGHDVTWWTSNFSHHFKVFRSTGWDSLPIVDGFTVKLVPTPGYRRNIGVGRFVRDGVFAIRTYLRGRNEPVPDLILMYESPLTFGFAGAALARHHKAAAIFDQMDLWPELIVRALPDALRRMGNLLFAPVYWRRRAVFRGIDGAMALARPYLESIIRELPAGSDVPTLIVYNGIDVATFRETMQIPLDEDMRAHFVTSDIKAIFAGSLGPSYDILNLIACAERANEDGLPLKIFVAGDGPLREVVEEAAARLPGLIYLGKLPPSHLPRVYRQCDIGLSCYTAKSNVEMPDKFYDYTAAGLAILNSLEGEVRDWIAAEGLGIHYAGGDSDSLYASLRKMVSDPDALAGMRARSAAVGARFDSSAQHAPLPAFVEEVVTRKRAQSRP